VEFPQNCKAMPEVPVCERIFSHESQAPSRSEDPTGRLERLVTLVTSGRRLRPLLSAFFRRSDCSPALSGDLSTCFDSRWGHTKESDGAWRWGYCEATVARGNQGWQSRRVAGGYDEVSRDRDRRVDDRVEKIARELLEFSEGERGQIVLDVLSQLKLTESAPLPASTPRAPGAVILANRLGRELLALAEDERTMVAFRLLARMGWVEKKGLPASTGWMDSGSSTRKTSRIGPLILAMLSAIAGAVFFGVQQHATRPQSSVTAPNDPPRAQSAPATREPSVDTGFEITSDPPGREVWIDGEPINGPHGIVRTDFRAMRVPAGTHRLELPGDDEFLIWQRVIDVQDGSIVKVHAVLVPAHSKAGAPLGWPGRWPAE